MKNFWAKQCECGAITVGLEGPNNESNSLGFPVSMPEKDFFKHFDVDQVDMMTGKFGNCDYCVNHWGIDLCGCGSGEKVGKCKNEFSECKHKTPSQLLPDLTKIY